LSGANFVYNSIFSGNVITDVNAIYGNTMKCSYCRVVNSLFDNNVASAEIRVMDGTSSNSNVIANSLFLNTHGKVLVSSSIVTKANLKYNFFDSADIGMAAGQVFQFGNFFNDDPGLDENYNIVAGSALIDAGYVDEVLFSLSETDFLGNPRIAGSGVDIGPIEYGSTVTLPQITLFELLNSSPKNLQDLSFDASYSLYGERTLSSLKFDNGSGSFVTIELDGSGHFQYQYTESGNKVVRLKVVDSEGEESITVINITVDAQSVSEVILLTQEACENDPSLCSIDTNGFVAQGYASALAACENDPSLCSIDTNGFVAQGYASALAACENDPSLCSIDTEGYVSQGYLSALAACENDPSLCRIDTEGYVSQGYLSALAACENDPSLCSIDTDSFVSQGYESALAACENDPSLCSINTEAYITTGKDICINDPSGCGIKTDFDYTQLPSTDNAGWKLLGTSEPITNMTEFSDVKVVWAQINDVWRAYSPNSEITDTLAAKNVQALTSIPAFSGFWVSK